MRPGISPHALRIPPHDGHPALRSTTDFSPAREALPPLFGYDAPHLGARGTATLLNNVLLSTHYGRSDSCSFRRGSARVSPRRPPVSAPARAGLPDSRSWPSDHSVPNHCRVPGPLPHAARVGPVRPAFWVGPRLRSRSAGSPHPCQPNRVRSPTDWSFTSCCSPPRLATTQLQAGYRSALDSSGEDFHLSDQVRFQAHRSFASLRMTGSANFFTPSFAGARRSRHVA